jgi:hypothetical protein
VSYLQTRLDGGALADPYLREILDFELALNALRLVPRGPTRSLRDNSAGSPSWRLNPLVRIVRFVHDPGPLLSALAAGAPPLVEPDRGDFHLMLDASGSQLAMGSSTHASLAGLPRWPGAQHPSRSAPPTVCSSTPNCSCAPNRQRRSASTAESQIAVRPPCTQRVLRFAGRRARVASARASDRRIGDGSHTNRNRAALA